MRSNISRGLLSATMVFAVITTAKAQPTIYNWIATTDVADWNVDANWEGNTLNFVPDADAIEDDSALINNGPNGACQRKGASHRRTGGT